MAIKNVRLFIFISGIITINRQSKITYLIILINIYLKFLRHSLKQGSMSTKTVFAPIMVKSIKKANEIIFL